MTSSAVMLALIDQPTRSRAEPSRRASKLASRFWTVDRLATRYDGAAVAFFSAGLLQGAGDFLAGLGLSGSIIAKSVVHGVVGGGMSVMGGGSFQSGFFANGSGAIGGVVTGVLGDSFGARVVRVVVASAAGGTASVWAGGKFANGAITGAFAQMFNEFGQHPGARGTQSGGDATKFDMYEGFLDDTPLDPEFAKSAGVFAGGMAAGEGAGYVIGRGLAWASDAFSDATVAIRNIFYKQADELGAWFTKYTPSQSKPYDILRRENIAGRPEWTTYEQYGRKAYEYAPRNTARPKPNVADLRPLSHPLRSPELELWP